MMGQKQNEYVKYLLCWIPAPRQNVKKNPYLWVPVQDEKGKDRVGHCKPSEWGLGRAV